MIKETTDYKMFKKHPCNVSIIEGNVSKIMKSIQIKNLLQHRPILVDAQFQVIDGQHRLEAAKRLGVPIFYEVQESLQTEDMRHLNSAMRIWKREEYLEHFCALGNRNYIKLKEYMKKTNLKIDNALVSLGFSKANSESKGSMSFKEGKFEFPDLETESEGLQLNENLNILRDYLKQKLEYSPYVKTARFIRAFYIFFSLKTVQFDVFMKKLPYRLDVLRPSSRLVDYLQSFQKVYNYNNRNPVEINDLV